MKMKWDQIGEKTYETGVDHGVIYPQKDGAYPSGAAWNGIIGVTENPSGAEDNALYADNMKYLNMKSAEEFGITIECYTYPYEFQACNGEAEVTEGVVLGQQSRNTFGFSYRTKKGNDTEQEDHGYKIHLVYGCSASPSERGYETINDSPNAITFSFECSTTPVTVSGTNPATNKPFKPVSLIVIDSTRIATDKLKELEDILYGVDGTGEGDSGKEARLPLPDELLEILSEG